MCLIHLSFYCQHWLKLTSSWSSKSCNGQENPLNTTQLAEVAVMLKIHVLQSRSERKRPSLREKSLLMFVCLVNLEL